MRPTKQRRQTRATAFFPAPTKPASAAQWEGAQKPLFLGIFALLLIVAVVGWVFFGR